MLRELAPTPADRAALEYDWKFWGRPSQHEPTGRWILWLILAGRGFGKTRSGAEWVRKRVRQGAQAITLVGRTAADVRDVMVEGESGILAISPDWERPKYEPSKRRITWPNGARATTYSADEPDQMRGPQSDTAWCDEVASWQFDDAYTQVRLGLRSSRSGLKPQLVATTTPRPTPLIRSLVADASTYVTRGSTFDNVGNMDPSFFAEVLRLYQGTRLGRQELYAEILDDVEGALWSRDLIEAKRVRKCPDELLRVVVAIDPAVSNNPGSDETGIVVVGLGYDGRCYVLADLSGKMSPGEWAAKAVKAFHDFAADRIVAEVNNGGDLVEVNVRTADKSVSYRGVHAAQGKRTRAEPVAALYEQKKISHVGGFAKLEDQMCTWEPLTGAKSPDRLDALVWGVSSLMLSSAPSGGGMGKKPIGGF